MDSLSSVTTILGIVHDILVAIETASQKKSRCNKVAERVRCIKDILEAAATQDDGTTSTDAATQRLMDRLKKALSDALQVVRQCQRSNDSFLGSVVCVFVAGGPMAADSLEEVEREINECILDLTFANCLRLETLVVRRRHNDDDVAAVASNSISENDDDDENKRKNKGSVESVFHDKMDHVDSTTTTAAVIGVPVCTVSSADVVVHERKHVTMDNGYCFTCRSYSSHCYYCHCCRDGNTSSNAALYQSQYYDRSLMFSDDNPNSCSIT